MLNSDFKEQNLMEISLKDVSSFYFQEIFDFILTGKIDLKDKNARFIIQVMKYASYFLLSNLTEICVSNCAQYLSDYTCFDFYLLSQRLCINYLKRISINYMIFRDPSFIDNKIIKKRLEKYATQEEIDSFNTDLTKKVKRNLVLLSDFLDKEPTFNPVSANTPNSYVDDLEDVLY